jgi:hypothetical protein
VLAAGAVSVGSVKSPGSAGETPAPPVGRANDFSQTLAVSAQHRRFRLRLNLGTAIMGGLIGFVLGVRLGMALGYAGADNQPLFFGYMLGTVGYFAGLGFFHPVFRWLRGRPAPAGAAQEYLYRYDGGVGRYDGGVGRYDGGVGRYDGGIGRYVRLTLDHKVIGIQYLVLILAMFCFGGFSAMLIRAELWTPNALLWPPDTYLTLVGLHRGRCRHTESAKYEFESSCTTLTPGRACPTGAYLGPADAQRPEDERQLHGQA